MTSDPAIDVLEALETLTGGLQDTIRRRAFGTTIESTIAIAQGATPNIADVERLGGFVETVRKMLGRDERHILRGALQDLQQIGVKVSAAQDQKALEEAGRLLSNDLKKDVTNIKSVLTSAWRRTVEAEFSTIGRLGSVLGQMPETQKLGLKMKELSGTAERLAGTLVSAKDQIAEIEALSVRKEKLNGELRKLGTDEEVVEFLLAVANQSATLDKLHEKVRDWLSERNALSLFKVRL